MRQRSTAALWQKCGAAALAVLLLSACATGAGRQRYEANFLVLFDTATSLVGYADSEATFTADAQFVYDALERYHQYYDIYHNYAGIHNLKTVNDNAGGAPVQVPQEIIDLLVMAKELYTRTEGKVNVAMGSVLSIWHDYRTRGLDDPAHATLPPMAELRAAQAHTDIKKLVIDAAAGTVCLTDPEMRLDVGAIAKGYATQRVTDEARAHGISSLLLSVGGNVSALGDQDGAGAPWRVGVQDPETAQESLHVLSVIDKTLVTSGSYQRCYTVDGTRYGHIIDPDTLLPADYFLSVTVLADDSGLADGLSTALFNLPYEQGLALLQTVPGAEAIWVLHDRSERYSPGFAAYLSS